MELVDLHTHTIASGHAYSSVSEMICAAKKKGLSLLGICEHGIAMPGTCHEYYFHNIKVLHRNYGNIRVLFGVEANIMDYSGNLDMDEHILDNLDYTIASIHWQCLKPGTVMENTNAYIGAMANQYVKIIGHPDDGRYPIDYREFVQCAKENNVLIEINNASLKIDNFRQDADLNIRTLLKYCEKYRADVVLASDAHTHYDVADFSNVKLLIQELSFPNELIINNNINKLSAYV